jgi:carboxypeptidase family protein
MRRRFQFCGLLLLVTQIAFPCSIVEVTVPPQKVNRNATIVALKDQKPLVGVLIALDRLGDAKTTNPVVRVRNLLTDKSGEIALRNLSPGIYALSVLEGERKHRLGSIQVTDRTDTNASRVEFELLPEASPPPVPPAPLLVSRIAGQLHDTSGAVFANTHFNVRRLQANDGKSEINADTDARGEFSLEVPDGNYELRLSVRGFNPAFVPLEVAADSRQGWAGIDLTLELAKCAPGMTPYLYSIKELGTEH